MKAKIIVLPVYQKHWLYYVWSESTAAETVLERSVSWTQGSSLHEKATLLGKEIGNRISTSAHRQWKSLQAAEEGTFKNRLYRLAQWVLSKEDTRETFLKSIPRDGTQLEVIHPSSLPERLVRRRLRRMARTQEAFHNRRILGWALATLPQLPLMITPFPNVTLYYTAYKVVSHYQALQGCRALRAAFHQYDQVERERATRAAADAAALAASANGSRGSGLLGFLPLCRRRGDAAQATASATVATAAAAAASSLAGSGAGPLVPLPHFRASQELDRAVVPLERWLSPLTDDMAMRVKEIFTAPPHLSPRPTRAVDKQPAHAHKATHTGAATAGPQVGGGAGGEGGGLPEGDGSRGGGLDALPELVDRLRSQVLETEAKSAGEDEEKGEGRRQTPPGSSGGKGDIKQD